MSVLQGFLDGLQPLPGQDHSQEGGGVDQHGLEPVEEVGED